MAKNKKLHAIGLLHQGIPAQEVADTCDISYGTALKYKREYDEAVLADKLSSLVDVDTLALEAVVAEAELLPEVKDAAKDLVEKLKPLDKLAVNFQTTATKLNVKVMSMISTSSSAVELEILSDILCKLQTTFISPQAPQVNVQNNYVSTEATSKYTELLSDRPK